MAEHEERFRQQQLKSLAKAAEFNLYLSPAL
jgi:hypothetical protein